MAKPVRNETWTRKKATPGYPRRRSEISPFAKVIRSNGLGRERINEPENREVCRDCGRRLPLRSMTYWCGRGWFCHSCRANPMGWALFT